MVLGLQIHIQLSYSGKKLFCACSIDNAKPNTNICPICCGHPGTLPCINELAIAYAYTAGKLFGCKLAESAIFDRKHYVYGDLPKGYQITQQQNPIGVDGCIDIGYNVQITSIRLEEDPARARTCSRF